MAVTIEDMPSLRVATVSHAGPYTEISEAFQRLGSIAASAGLLRDDAMMVAIYYEDPETTQPRDLHSDAGVTVADSVRLPAGVVEKRLPAGRYARATHIGPYGTLPDAWSQMMRKSLPHSELKIGQGPTFEVYRNDPSNTPPEKLRTDLYVPVADR